MRFAHIVWKYFLGSVCMLLFAQPPIDTLYGLLGRKLEMPKAAFSGLLPKGSFQRKVWYRSTLDTLWEGIRLAEVRYAFYQDKLHTIQIRVEGAEASEAMRILLETLLGPGQQEGYAPRYRWTGQRAYLIYDQNILTKNTEIRIESLVLQRQLELDAYREFQSR
ncbi:MAG: hypothetical protein RMJ66_06345 [Bacteroidia bacterium]|nr:hypothetical protein [Bacteroidia bacterium]MDW8134672.1 hypothetical protein [Bacteroidia bacterium]